MFSVCWVIIEKYGWDIMSNMDNVYMGYYYGVQSVKRVLCNWYDTMTLLYGVGLSCVRIIRMKTNKSNK